jgi:3-phosphoshikimate 1-carboxyvinyltransferase
MQLELVGPARNLRGTLAVPGDKSITHRALLLAAMAPGTSQLQGALRAGVIEAMQGCLEAMGVEFARPNGQALTVRGRAWRSPASDLDCRGSGTTMRLLLGALAGSKISATLSGTARLAQRPMGRVVDPLRRMGARIAGANGVDRPPLQIDGTRLRGIEFEMPVASAQVKTAILLAGLHAQGRTILHEPVATRDHTERLLQQLGVSVTRSGRRLCLEPLEGPLAPFELAVPGDFSSAAFLLAAALLSPGSELTLRGVGLNPLRTGLLEALKAMGAAVEIHGGGPSKGDSEGEPVGALTVRSSELRGINLGGDRLVSLIDEVPILTVVATQCLGVTRLHGASELRLKESDRLSVMTAELRKMGAEIEEHPDGITIEGPSRLQGTEVSSHGDHRVAMALAVAGAVADGETIISGAEVIGESYPGFAAALHSMGVDLQ